MKHFEFSFKNPSGIKLYGQGWEPVKNKPRAAVLIIHGLGEHSGRYQHVAEAFVKRGFAVFANDRAGHGKSKGKRGHAKRYEDYFDDVNKLHAEAVRKYADIPCFAYGHSMGGNVVLNYMLSKKRTGLAGIISTGAALELNFEPPKFKLFLGKIMLSLYPAFTERNGLDLQQLSRDPEVIKAYQNDPLVHDKVTAITGIGILNYGKKALEKVGKVNLPLLIMHGGDDGITSAKGSEKFANKAQGDVTLKIWEGLRHEIHNEPEQREVINTMIDWMMAKLGGK
ncbi:MAG: lysophospholipase [Saprospiraceae bacterium]|nr:lysophospholipase [Saprospiraceae bacterium]